MTIASKARSGVKSPVLKGHGVRLHFVAVDRKKIRKERKRTARKENEKK